MAILKSAHALGLKPTPVPAGSEVVVCRAEYTLTADMTTSEVIQMMNLPANCVPVDLILDFDAMGAGTLAVGLGDGATVTTTWLGSTAVTSAGAARADAAGLRTMAQTAASDTENRAVYVDVLTDTTATSGKIGLTLMYRTA